MEWSWIPSSAVAIANAIALAVWKPWAQAYAGEKGKNLARKEDLDIILAEVRAITATQKEIEAKISGDLWMRQWRLNQTRDAYVGLLRALSGLLGAHADRTVMLKRGAAMPAKEPNA